VQEVEQLQLLATEPLNPAFSSTQKELPRLMSF
jgi:hypothetical protein